MNPPVFAAFLQQKSSNTEKCSHVMTSSHCSPAMTDGITPAVRLPLPWASVHWPVQCTLECHWNATGWPSVHWDTTGRPSEYLQGTLEHHGKKLSWILPTLECHRRNSNFCSLHWNTTGGTVTAYTRPDTYLSMQSSMASTPVWNEKMAGHQ